MYASHQQSQNSHWSMKHFKNSHGSVHIYQGSTHTLFQFLLSLSYTSITWLTYYRTQKPILSWFETRRKTQATVFRCNIPRASCQWETRVTQLQYQYLWQKVIAPWWTLNREVHNISSCTEYYKQVQFIESRKYLASVLYKISASLFQHLMMWLACTPYLILMMHFTCTKSPHWYWWYASLVLHILAHIAHTPYRVHIDKRK